MARNRAQQRSATRAPKGKAPKAEPQPRALVLDVIDLNMGEAEIFEEEIGLSPVDFMRGHDKRPLLNLDGDPVLDDDGEPEIRVIPMRVLRVLHFLYMRRQDSDFTMEQARGAKLEEMVEVDPTGGASSG